MKTIFYHGDIITLTQEKPEAILVEKGKIQKLGNKEEIFAHQDKDTRIVDLQGKTLMPSFMDAHSHFSSVANNLLQLSLIDCTSIQEIQQKLVNYKESEQIKDGEWIIVNQYDHNRLPNQKHITKQEIDEILPNNPVVIQHQSGHCGVFNQAGLSALGITSDTPSPEGGKIGKEGNELTGYVEENAFLSYLKKVPLPTIEKIIKAYQKAQEIYLSYGITTVQEGFMVKEMIPLFQELIRQNVLSLDLVAYVDIPSAKEIEEAFVDHIKKYSHRIKIGGYKIFLDGSPQARTAWMRKAYQGKEEYSGYSTMKTEEVEKAVKLAAKNQMQLLAHCNGDKACEQYIEAISTSTEIQKLRPVMIHAQLLGLDQLRLVKQYGIIPSFFVAHTYYWGDVHLKNFGEDRARVISPAGSSLVEDILFTFHQDSPVIEPDMLETIWCAVQRKTKEGIELAKEERISVLDAIKAVTCNVAYQYGEEKQKGTIEVGKLADFVILDQNPLMVDLDQIKTIQVLETIKEGKTLWNK